MQRSFSYLLGLVKENQVDLAICGKGKRLDDASSVIGLDLGFHYSLRMVSSKRFQQMFFKKVPTLQLLSSLPHIFLQDSPTRFQEWYHQNFGSRPTLKLSIECDNLFSAISAACLHMGLALLPSDIIYDELASGKLVQIKDTLDSPTFCYQVIQIKNRIPAISERTFLQFLREKSKRAKSSAN